MISYSKLRNMSPQQRAIYHFFPDTGKVPEGLKIDHRDLNLQFTNPDRFYQYRIDDLAVYTKQEYVQRHQKFITDSLNVDKAPLKVQEADDDITDEVIEDEVIDEPVITEPEPVIDNNNDDDKINEPETPKKKIYAPGTGLRIGSGTIWINNGIKSKRLKPGEEMPIGYVEGRIMNGKVYIKRLKKAPLTRLDAQIMRIPDVTYSDWINGFKAVSTNISINCNTITNEKELKDVLTRVL